MHEIEKRMHVFRKEMHVFVSECTYLHRNAHQNGDEGSKGIQLQKPGYKPGSLNFSLLYLMLVSANLQDLFQSLLFVCTFGQASVLRAC